MNEEQHSTDGEQEKAFTFNLKNDEQMQTEDVTFQSDIKTDEIEPSKNKTDEVSFASLSALGLSPDDEFDLLNDFITDAKESIDTIEQFTRTKDFDKINYSLVKIKSSAEILNLDAIIDDANSIRKHCITENSEKVIQDTKRLKENIGLLEKRLEATAI
jgi:HPt (histidine-containing phosphotransfer) domain-containing protein